jgi:hypothetical protein
LGDVPIHVRRSTRAHSRIPYSKTSTFTILLTPAHGHRRHSIKYNNVLAGLSQGGNSAHETSFAARDNSYKNKIQHASKRRGINNGGRRGSRGKETILLEQEYLSITCSMSRYQRAEWVARMRKGKRRENDNNTKGEPQHNSTSHWIDVSC